MNNGVPDSHVWGDSASFSSTIPKKSVSQDSTHASIGGTMHKASNAVTGSTAERASESATEALHHTETEALNGHSLTGGRIRSSSLSKLEQISRFANSVLRTSSQDNVHKSHKKQVEGIHNDAKRQRITDQLDACQVGRNNGTMTEEAAAKQQDFLEKAIKAEIKAQEWTASIGPESLKRELTEELSNCYLLQEQGLSSEDAQINERKIEKLKNKGLLTLSKLSPDDSKETQLKDIKETVLLALAYQKKMQLWGETYNKEEKDYDKISDYLKTSEQYEKFNNLTPPHNMNEKTFRLLSKQIDKDLEHFVNSEEFQMNLNQFMEQLENVDNLQKSAEDILNTINEKTLRNSLFMSSLQEKREKGLLNQLFPLRKSNITKEGITELSERKLVLADLAILDCVRPPLGLADREQGAEQKPIKEPLSSVKDFNTEGLEAIKKHEDNKIVKLNESLVCDEERVGVLNLLKEELKKTEKDKKQLTEVEKELSDLSSKIKDRKKELMKLEFSVASSALKIFMQKQMAKIHQDYDEKRITLDEAEMQLLQLQSNVMKQYDEVRDNFSDLQACETLRTSYLSNILVRGARAAMSPDFTPSTMSSSQIAGDLMTQMWQSMGFDRERLTEIKKEYEVTKQGVKLQESDELSLIHRSRAGRALDMLMRSSQEQKIHDWAKKDAAGVALRSTRRALTDTLDDCYTKLAQGNTFNTKEEILQHIDKLKEKELLNENPPEISFQLSKLEKIQKYITEVNSFELSPALQHSSPATQRLKLAEKLKYAMFNQFKMEIWNKKYETAEKLGEHSSLSRISKKKFQEISKQVAIEAETMLEKSPILKEKLARLAGAENPYEVGEEMLAATNEEALKAASFLNQEEVRMIEGDHLRTDENFGLAYHFQTNNRKPVINEREFQRASWRQEATEGYDLLSFFSNQKNSSLEESIKTTEKELQTQVDKLKKATGKQETAKPDKSESAMPELESTTSDSTKIDVFEEASQDSTPVLHQSEMEKMAETTENLSAVTQGLAEIGEKETEETANSVETTTVGEETPDLEDLQAKIEKLTIQLQAKKDLQSALESLGDLMHTKMGVIRDSVREGSCSLADAEKRLAHLESQIMKDYEKMRSSYSSYHFAKQRRSMIVAREMEQGTFKNPEISTPPLQNSKKIQKELMQSMCAFMNEGAAHPSFSPEKLMESQIKAQESLQKDIKAIQEGFVTGRKKIDDEISKTKNEIKEMKIKETENKKFYLSAKEANMMKMELFPKLMKKKLYDGISRMESLPISEQKEEIKKLHEALKGQSNFFKEKVPGATDYGDVSRLADLDEESFANFINECIGRL